MTWWPRQDRGSTRLASEGPLNGSPFMLPGSPEVGVAGTGDRRVLTFARGPRGRACGALCSPTLVHAQVRSRGLYKRSFT